MSRSLLRRQNERKLCSSPHGVPVMPLLVTVLLLSFGSFRVLATIHDGSHSTLERAETIGKEKYTSVPLTSNSRAESTRQLTSVRQSVPTRATAANTTASPIGPTRTLAPANSTVTHASPTRHTPQPTTSSPPSSIPPSTLTPTLFPTDIPTSAPTHLPLEQVMYPLRMLMYEVEDTFELKSTLVWENRTTDQVESFYDTSQDVSDLQVHTRMISIRPDFYLSGNIEHRSVQIQYAQSVYYRTGNLANTPEMIVTEPFSSEESKTAYIASLQEHDSNTTAFNNVTFVSDVIIEWPDPPLTSISPQMNMVMYPVSSMDKTAQYDWQEAMNSYIESYWEEQFFLDRDVKFYGLSVSTNFISQEVVARERDALNFSGADAAASSAMSLRVSYEQYFSYYSVGSEDTRMEFDPAEVAMAAFDTVEKQDVFIDKLKGTRNPAFTFVTEVTDVVARTADPTPSPTLLRPSMSPSIMPTRILTLDPTETPTQEVFMAKSGASPAVESNSVAIATPVVVVSSVAACVLGIYLFGKRRIRDNGEPSQEHMPNDSDEVTSGDAAHDYDMGTGKSEAAEGKGGMFDAYHGMQPLGQSFPPGAQLMTVSPIDSTVLMTVTPIDDYAGLSSNEDQLQEQVQDQEVRDQPS